MVDWRKYDLVEHRRGRYRLERQTWGFFDWAALLIIVAVVARFWWVFALVAAVVLVSVTCTVVIGAVLSFVGRDK